MSHQSQCYKQTPKSNRPRYSQTPGSRVAPQQGLGPGARGRGAASALSALTLCPLTVLWDNIPFRSRRPICQWAALFVVIYSVTASRGPVSRCPP